MLEHLKNHFNETTTENGAKSYKSTKSYVLDLFANGGVYRNQGDVKIQELVSKAYSEDALLTMKTLFYIRDVRGGLGERRFFNVAIEYLAKHHPESVKKNLLLFSEFGRWDDLLVLLNTSLKKDIVTLISFQLSIDINSDNPSLLAKWMPSENSSSTETKRFAHILIKEMGTTHRKYRKLLSHLRNKLDILETKLTNREYYRIDYSKLPSRAGMIYRTAFFKNDLERYEAFLEKLSNREVKVNSGTLYPYEIIEKILGNSIYSSYNGIGDIREQEIKLFNGQWNNLPDYIDGRKENSIAVVDVSGSMTGTPMNVAISLGMYLAERIDGIFKNHFFTFSEKPELQEIIGDNIVEKAMNLRRSSWGFNTNIKMVFEKILKTAVANNISQEEMIDKVFIISDMQFDKAIRDGKSRRLFEVLKEEYEYYGYKLPNLVFWNVDARDGNLPFTKDENGVQLVSGFSPTIFSTLLGSETINPYEYMLEVINSERYEKVKA